MKRVFISQPMAGQTLEEIKAKREGYWTFMQAVYPDAVLINSLFEDFGESEDIKNEALYSLGASILKLAEADVAYFAKGWDKARGCRIEHLCASEYGIEIIDANNFKE